MTNLSAYEALGKRVVSCDNKNFIHRVNIASEPAWGYAGLAVVNAMLR